METMLSKPITERIDASTARLATRLLERGLDPQLAIVLVGEDPASIRYVDIKSRRAKELRIDLSVYHFSADSTATEIEESVRFLATDPDVDGLIIQLPLPETYKEMTDRLLSLVPSAKDVDGLAGGWVVGVTAASARTLEAFLRSDTTVPPMIAGVLSLLDQYKIELEAAKIVIVGSGRLVGAPLLAYMLGLGLDVQAVTEETDHILDITTQADVLICGTGVVNLVTYQWIKEGAVVIDCAADVHPSVSERASALAPSKGGIGPLTVAWLLHNVVRTVERSFNE
jgi:methylenetetrahydrofolate dehydrogenase (NADP+)/methenyltetrahydrofolate cyclohydrolase